MYPHMDTIYLPYNMKYAVMATGAIDMYAGCDYILLYEANFHAQPAEWCSAGS